MQSKAITVEQYLAELPDDGLLATGGDGRCFEGQRQIGRFSNYGFKRTQFGKGSLRAKRGTTCCDYVRKGIRVSRGYGGKGHRNF